VCLGHLKQTISQFFSRSVLEISKYIEFRNMRFIDVPDVSLLLSRFSECGDEPYTSSGKPPYLVRGSPVRGFSNLVEKIKCNNDIRDTLTDRGGGGFSIWDLSGP
jgi:hypothetical protein